MRYRRLARPLAALAIALSALAACGPAGGRDAAGSSAAGDTSPPASGGAQAMKDMPGMVGLPGDVPGTSMQSHLQMMRAVGGDSLRSMLPMHRQMVATMLVRMNGEMRQMNMPADAAWDATVDSLRQDLVRLPDLSAAELKAVMPAHAGRVQRLTEMHQRMMAQMKQ